MLTKEYSWVSYSRSCHHFSINCHHYLCSNVQCANLTSDQSTICNTKFSCLPKTARMNFTFLGISPNLQGCVGLIFATKSQHISNKAVLEPRVSPAFASTYFCNHCNIRFENTSKYVDTLILFSKNLNQRSLTPTWPLTLYLLRSHVWLYPRIIVSKSHDNTSMYVDTVINFANYHIHTIHILHTNYVQNEWSHSLLLNSVQARQKCVPIAFDENLYQVLLRIYRAMQTLMKNLMKPSKQEFLIL